MRGLIHSTWLLGSLVAVSAALVVTLCHAAPGSSASAAEGWSMDERAVLASLSLKRLAPMPADPSNAFERLPAAIEFGRRLFMDARFSSHGAVSCSSCHDPHQQFQDGLPVGRGAGTGSRRTMPGVFVRRVKIGNIVAVISCAINTRCTRKHEARVLNNQVFRHDLKMHRAGIIKREHDIWRNDAS